MKIYLDPGHGGSDPGAIGNGIQEKEVVLDLAKRIKQQLEVYTGVSIKLSRTTDITKSLTARTNEANVWGQLSSCPFIAMPLTEKPEDMRILFITN